MKLYKTTIEILTDYNPCFLPIEQLARDATFGDAYCVGQNVADVDSSEYGEAVEEFFGCLPEDEEDE